MKYPVRCCCTPTKILGHLELPAGLRAEQSLPIKMADGSIERILIRSFGQTRIAMPEAVADGLAPW